MSEDAIQSGSYDSAAQIGESPSAIVKRWDLELSLADKEEKEWRKKAEAIYEQYRAAKKKKNSFNILWSNTETMRQAIYNTLPTPDVRRRFGDDDPVGKVVSEVLARCATYAMDVYDFDHTIKMDVLDALLGGRGLSRVKYVPDIEDIESDKSQGEAEGKETTQRLAYERVMCEHVQWDDFLRGPGKTWDEMRWVAFRHRFSRDAGIEKFGAVFRSIKLDQVADEDVKKADDAVSDLFKTLEVWEIWDKDSEKVLFIARSHKTEPLQTIPDPLGLDGFFPIPRPFYAVEDASCLVPTPLYELYKEQADELNLITARLNKLTDALKLRGVYNSVLSELSALTDAGDNQLLPANDVQALIESGGLEKHIWFMPIEQAAKVIQILGVQREACKQVIYEITGMSDIMRAATDPHETFGAQKIKAQWGTQRLKKMQAECQRYIRDIIRLKCQIIATKFQPETVKQMTGLKMFDTEAEKQQVQMQAQQYQQFQAQQQMQGVPQ